MDRFTVAVAPVQGGWSVVSPLSIGPLMFLSSEIAAEQAERLAELAVRLGWDAEIRLHSSEGETSARAYAAREMARPMARDEVKAALLRGARLRPPTSGTDVSHQGLPVSGSPELL